MALKSKEWFYKQCLKEVKRYGRLCHLCWDILEKGIGQTDSTRGHCTQAIGACQEFLIAHPTHRAAIKATDPTLPFNVASATSVRNDLRAWLAQKQGQYGRGTFGYNYTTLKGILTPSLGGTRRGGGGGDDEFKRVLRLMAEFAT